MPPITLGKASYPKRASVRFDVLPGIGSFEVIATDTGRPIAQWSTRHEAEEFCGYMNEAAKKGRRALAVALGATAEPV